MKKTFARKIGSLLLAMALVLVMCPVAPQQVQAATTAADTCPCCGKSYDSISWLSSGYTNRDLSKPGHYKLVKAFTLSTACEITGNVVVDVNGYLLRAAAGKRGFVVKSGGTLTFLNRSTASNTNNGRLQGLNTTADGGAIYVEEGGTLNLVSGRVLGTTMSYDGGAIYNAGTVNMYGGSVETGNVTGDGGNIYNVGTLNIYDGVIKKGVVKSGYGGNVFNAGTMKLEGGLITGGTANGDNAYGGNIYNGATFLMQGGTVESGTSQDHGGNLFTGGGAKFHMYGGTLTGGKSTGYGSQFNGHGGNIYATGATADVKIFGGTVTGGQNTSNSSYGGNIFGNSGVQIYMYGGTLSYGAATHGGNVYVTGSDKVDTVTQQSAFYLLGGTILGSQERDLSKAAANLIQMYNGRYEGSVDISGFVQDCSCCVTTGNSHVIWNPGYEDGTCTDCLYAQAAAEDLPEDSGGGHNYQLTGEDTYTCSGCGNVRILENVVATVGGELFESLEEAVTATSSDETLTLMADATVTELAMFGTLDLNGKTITAEAFSSTTGHVIDTSADNAGKLICSDVSLAADNAYLPVTYEGGIRFCPVDFKQWVEPVSKDVIKIRFYITQRTYQTLLDDAIKAGNTEIQVQLRLTWTDSNGTAQQRTYTFPHELLQKYTEKWNGRMFVATVSGMADVTDLTCAYQVTSTAGTGATRSARTQTPAGYINEKLTWDAINAFPIKTADMTVDEMRQLCVDFMYFTKTYLWTPDQSIDYIKNASGTKDTMTEGTIYGGLPYVGVASGNPYRMMDYIDDAGILDMQKALPALGTKDILTMADLKYFGSQCSESVYWGWGRVMNSAKYMWTSSVVPKNGFVLLGDIAMDETIKSWSAAYNTDLVCEANGEQVMYAAYAQAKKADGMVYYVEASDGDGAGHLVMIYADAVVVYNTDGTINGDESYLYIIDQGQRWEEATSDSGDIYQRKHSINYQYTFAQLYSTGYIPFTFKEFLGTDPIEETEVSLVKGSTTLAGGVIAEDGSFQTTATAESLTWKNLFASQITSNYGIVDAYIIVRDNKGNELYKHAVRTGTAGNKALSLLESGASVTTWVTQKLVSGKTYNAEIVVQLATGERPTVWSGQLTMDN